MPAGGTARKSKRIFSDGWWVGRGRKGRTLRLRAFVRRAARRVTQTRSSARTAERDCEKLTTDNTVDTEVLESTYLCPLCPLWWRACLRTVPDARRSEEHTSELQ